MSHDAVSPTADTSAADGPAALGAGPAGAQIHQSAVSVVLRRLVVLAAVACLAGGAVVAVMNPLIYGGWVLLTVGLVGVVMAMRSKQLMDDGMVRRRSRLRAGGDRDRG